MNRSAISGTRLHILILILVPVLVYANTLKAPFYLDDRPFLLENAAIRDMGKIPSFFAGRDSIIASRPVMLSSFALNYRLDKYDPEGYHLFNISLHALAGVLLYLLIIRTARLMGNDDPHDDTAPMAALLSSLLFAAHPLHTEAVNYISARSSLLVACFYLLGVLLFAQAAKSGKHRPIYVAALVLTSLLGMGSKESFITFPAILLLYDYCFISRGDVKAVLRNMRLHLPVAITALYAIYLILTYKTQAFSYGTPRFGALEYFMTQWNVHMTYIRMLILPYGLNFDHDFPAAHALLEWPTTASLIGYVALWAGGLALLKRHPAIGFCVLWFMVTLTPDSSLVPTRFNLIEYRAYLPSAGFLTALSIAATAIAQRRGIPLKYLAAAVGLTAMLFGGISIVRNTVWNDTEAMWADVVSKSPSNPRGHYNRGVVHIDREQYAEALAEMRRTTGLDPSYVDAHYNMGLLLMSNSPSASAESFERVMALNPDYPNLNVYLGNLYTQLKQYDKAVTAYEKAVSQQKDEGGYVLLGFLYLYKKSDPDRAIMMFEEALGLNPENETALSGIAGAYEKKGMKDKALEFRNKIARAPAPAPSMESLFKESLFK